MARPKTRHDPWRKWNSDPRRGIRVMSKKEEKAMGEALAASIRQGDYADRAMAEPLNRTTKEVTESPVEAAVAPGVNQCHFWRATPSWRHWGATWYMTVHWPHTCVSGYAFVDDFGDLTWSPT